MRDADAIHVSDHIDDHRQPQHSMPDAGRALLRRCGSSHKFLDGWLLGSMEWGTGGRDFTLAAPIPHSLLPDSIPSRLIQADVLITASGRILESAARSPI